METGRSTHDDDKDANSRVYRVNEVVLAVDVVNVDVVIVAPVAGPGFGILEQIAAVAEAAVLSTRDTEVMFPAEMGAEIIVRNTAAIVVARVALRLLGAAAILGLRSCMLAILRGLILPGAVVLLFFFGLLALPLSVLVLFFRVLLFAILLLAVRLRLWSPVRVLRGSFFSGLRLLGFFLLGFWFVLIPVFVLILLRVGGGECQ